MSQDSNKEVFTVKDKRRFVEEKENESRETAKEETIEKEEKEPAPEDQKSQALPPEVNFASFMISLSTSVYIHLGLVPDPISQAKKQNLSLAKQSIDIIEMLKNKTSNNLTKEETQLMDNILYDIRMKYVEAFKKQ